MEVEPLMMENFPYTQANIPSTSHSPHRIRATTTTVYLEIFILLKSYKSNIWISSAEKRKANFSFTFFSIAAFFLLCACVYSKFGISLLFYFSSSFTFPLLSSKSFVSLLFATLSLSPSLTLSGDISLFHVCLPMLELHIPLKTAFSCKIHVKMHSQNIFACPTKRRKTGRDDHDGKGTCKYELRAREIRFIYSCS